MVLETLCRTYEVHLQLFIEQFDASLVLKNFYFNFSPITVAFYQQQDVLKCDKIPLQFWSSTSIKAAATLIKSAVKLKQHEKWVQNGREWHQWKMNLISLCRLCSHSQLPSSGCNRQPSSKLCRISQQRPLPSELPTYSSWMACQQQRMPANELSTTNNRQQL